MRDRIASTLVERDDKNEEEVPRRIGVPASAVVDALYRQTVFQGGIPFSLTLPSSPTSHAHASSWHSP